MRFTALPFRADWFGGVTFERVETFARGVRSADGGGGGIEWSDEEVDELLFVEAALMFDLEVEAALMSALEVDTLCLEVDWK